MTEYSYGGFWRRSVAATIDQIILWIIYVFLFVMGAMAGLSGFDTSSYSFRSDILTKTAVGLMLVYYIFCLLINVGYFTYFHGITGQTPGKMAMSLKVMQVSGDEMTPGIAFLRWVGYLVSSFCFCLGYIWVAFDPRKQGWHDKIAGTVVILKREKYLDKAGDI